MNALMTAQAPAAPPMAMEGYGEGIPAAPPQYQEWDLAKKVRCFEDAEEATDNARQMSERCRDYYDGKQLTATEKATLALRGQPDVVINRIQGKVNYLLGYEATLRTDPRGRPRTEEDEEAAEYCTDALNYVRDTSDEIQCFSQCWENMLIEGAGGSEIVPTLKDGDAKIIIKKAHWDRLFWDPHSREFDFSDARYLGYVIWMDEDDVLSEWPDAEEAIAKTISDESKLTYSDRPRWRQWASVGSHRKRVRIVQMYYKCKSVDGKDECWHSCIFTKGGEIEGTQVPYRDDDDVSLCPLILQSAFVDRENNRYGFVQALLGPQDEINKRRSKMLHEATMRQFLYEDGAVEDVDLAKQELAKPDGGVKTTPGFKFELLDRSKELSAHAALQTEAKQEIDLMGPNSSMQGEMGGAPSGRAILANQSGGQVEIAPLVDRHNHYKARIHKLVWAMIRMYWTAEKIVAVTDDEENTKFVKFNRPITMAEALLKKAAEQGLPEEEAKAKLREAAMNPDLAAQLQQVVGTENVPADMGMDIILDSIPDNANIQQEQFQILGDLAKSGIPLPPKLLIKASSLRNKKELLAEMDKAEEAAANDPMQAEQTKLQLEGAMAEITKIKAEIAEIVAKTKNIEADSIKKLAEADAVDQTIGTVTDPEVISADGSVTPAKQTPQAMPTPQSPAIKQAIAAQAQGMHQMPDGSMMDDSQMQGGEMPMEQQDPGNPYMDQGPLPQPNVPDVQQAQQGAF